MTKKNTTAAGRRKTPVEGRRKNKRKVLSFPDSCPACGKPVEGDWKVCPACGANIDPAAIRNA